jgi:hypothetical protein
MMDEAPGRGRIPKTPNSRLIVFTRFSRPGLPWPGPCFARTETPGRHQGMIQVSISGFMTWDGGRGLRVEDRGPGPRFSDRPIREDYVMIKRLPDQDLIAIGPARRHRPGFPGGREARS